MILKALALLQVWADAEKRIALFAPDESLLSIEVDGYNEISAGKFRLANGDPAFVIPFASVTAAAAAFIRVEGFSGANLTVNGLTARQLRPPTNVGSTDEESPAAFWLETAGNLSTLSIVHPGPSGGDPDANPIEGFYLIVGDPVP